MARKTHVARITVALAIAAIAVCLVFAWRWLRQPSEAEQLLDILAGKSIPDAAWALERLRMIPKEDLRSLARHVDDDRPAPLDPAYNAGRSVGTGVVRLLLSTVASDILGGRIFRDGVPEEGPVPGEASQWSAEVDRWLSSKKASGPEAHTLWQRAWLRIFAVRPPSLSPDAVQPMTAETAACIAGCLRGDDKALAVWMVETLRDASDGALDALAHLVTSTERTKVSFFGCKEDPVARKQGFALGPLVQMILAERLEDATLYYNVRRAAEEWFGYDCARLARQVEAAWKEREGHRR